jgi:hypothetical protein
MGFVKRKFKKNKKRRVRALSQAAYVFNTWELFTAVNV